MLDRPWIRALLGVLAAAALGAVAARVVGAGSPGGGSPAGMSSGAGPGSSGSFGGSGGGEDGGGRGSSGGSSGGGEDGGGVALTSGGGRITVHVAGAVRRPGVYRLAEGDRVFQAVRRAGGTAPRADRQRLNLAAPLRDGQQVLVPARTPAGGGGGGSSGAGGADAPVDLNSADEEELQELDGVGRTTAAKIVALREQRGGLGGVDDLDEVPGIGPKTLETLRGQLGG